ncbi:MAG: UDP-N-acetylmuramoyl-L-alanyl-D-glutamate--2,6-diaminopimelate ligase [Candidatus Eremiobacterota bacterium]
MKYEELLSQVNLSDRMTGIVYDSRKVSSGDIFVCIKGFKTDGHDYVRQAIDLGASVIVSEKYLDLDGKTELVITENSRKALAELSAACYNHPSLKMKLFGITGTNGKTTTAYMIEHIMKKVSLKTGLIGTIEVKTGNKSNKTKNTTPESLDLQEIFYQMISHGVEAVPMEVSSHALSLFRVWNCFFTGVIYTNFSHDHLDFHESLDDYWKVKGSFLPLQKEFSCRNMFSVFNCDDPNVIKLLPHGNGRIFVYGVGMEGRDFPSHVEGVFASDVSFSPSGIECNVLIGDKIWPLKLKLMGMFNVYNALAAICTGLAQDVDFSMIKEALEEMEPVKGRIYPVNTGKDFICIVDYAHTPDGLDKVLTAAREFTPGRLITVFGCGGDRDTSKRPLMGSIASHKSDYIIITSDNPRSEDPVEIISHIEQGITDTSVKYIIEPDRRLAIGYAVDMARKGDTVVVAGKGHENYQIFKDRTIHFDDCEVIREFTDRK